MYGVWQSFARGVLKRKLGTQGVWASTFTTNPLTIRVITLFLKGFCSNKENPTFENREGKRVQPRNLGCLFD